jgi:chromosome partitioning protein
LLKKILKDIKSEYDFILIDTPPTNILALELSFFASDYISIVVNPERKSFDSFTYLREEIEKLSEDAKEYMLDIKIGAIILTKIKKKTSTSDAFADGIKELCEEGGYPLYCIEQKEIFVRADAENKALIAYPERAEALNTVYELIDYAIDLIIERKDKK